jgi:hypothetical protein
MTREKRSLIRKTVNFAPSTWEQLEMFMEQENVRSMSDFLHRICDEHIAIRIAQQKVGRRVVNQ